MEARADGTPEREADATQQTQTGARSQGRGSKESRCRTTCPPTNGAKKAAQARVFRWENATYSSQTMSKTARWMGNAGISVRTEW